MKKTITYILLFLLLHSCVVEYPMQVVEVRTYRKGYQVYEFVPVVDSAALRYYEARQDFYRDYQPPPDCTITVREYLPKTNQP